MTRYAFAERQALADRMEQVGPGAPTLCGDWTVRDLLAHLLLRERRPDAAPGILVKRLAGRTDKVQQVIARGDFAESLRKLRNPPWWSPVSNPLVDETANVMEMFVHHEDVRRARPDWEPRDLPKESQAALWKQVSRRVWMARGRFPASAALHAPGFGTIRTGSRDSGDQVTITGTPAELLLFVTGRQAHSHVALDGPPEVVDRLRAAPLGV